MSTQVVTGSRVTRGLCGTGGDREVGISTERQHRTHGVVTGDYQRNWDGVD